MNRYVTFTTYTDEDPQVLTESEFFDTPKNDTDWCEWVWQYAPDRATALSQHQTKMDEYQADVEAGRTEKRTY
jgi:hypothetical protein